MKRNCWEFKGCGRQPGGKNAEDMGVCQASLAIGLNGVHEGTNGGRACWVVAGTLCGGAIQGTFAQKYTNCAVCDFYQSVKEEENGNYELSIVLLNRLRRAERKAARHLYSEL